MRLPWVVRVAGVAAVVASMLQVGTWAAELKPATAAAFDRYVRVTEARIDREVQDEERFLLIDTADPARRPVQVAELRAGGVLIERLETREDNRELDIPSGLVHHWVGLVFVDGGTLDGAVALLQDYDRHAEVYRPAVQQSRVLSRTGDTFRVFLRFYMKKVIAVTLNSDHEAQFTRVSPTRAFSRIVSTRVQEVADAGKPTEREQPPGHGGGYLWRINSYWRFLERDGGVYVQCESVSLSRGLPFALAWLIRPFVTSLPRESLTFTLETTRKALVADLESPRAIPGPHP
ncbi:MAG: hypothetical protein OEW19_14815 [Acidobacteriota bacterium]|nr:hypothetical protein [Acidobacteriota bacterium]